LAQSERYARGFRGGKFEFGEFHLPFVYSTNGKLIWFHDLRNPISRSRKVAKFHTPNALKELLMQDTESAFSWFLSNPIDDSYLRPYQVEAINAVEETLRTRREKVGLLFTSLNHYNCGYYSCYSR
jgi:type I restriction enzyme R subunit